jgi:AraC-like DNA-binding protein
MVSAWLSRSAHRSRVRSRRVRADSLQRRTPGLRLPARLRRRRPVHPGGVCRRRRQLRHARKRISRDLRMSPKAMTTAMRLSAARRAFLHAGETTTVTDVALRTGFVEFGRLSVLYRRHYGEMPSAGSSGPRRIRTTVAHNLPKLRRRPAVGRPGPIAGSCVSARNPLIPDARRSRPMAPVMLCSICCGGVPQSRRTTTNAWSEREKP